MNKRTRTVKILMDRGRNTLDIRIETSSFTRPVFTTQLDGMIPAQVIPDILKYCAYSKIEIIEKEDM